MALAAAQAQSLVIATIGTIGYALRGSIDWPLALVVGGTGSEVDGLAAIGQPDSLMLQAAPDRPDVAQSLLQWLIRTAQGPTLTVAVFDDQPRTMFTQAGFEPAPPPFGFYQMQ